MKKFIISSDALRPALKKLGQAINTNSVLPITKNIYCKVGKNEVELITTNMEITISYKLVCETGKDEPYELLIPFDYFNEVIGAIKNAPIVIEHPSARKLKIVCEEDTFETALEKIDDFPQLPAHPKKPLIIIEENFADLLSTALHTCSKDELRPAMTRALFDVNNGQSFIVSTDAYTLFRHSIKVSAEEPKQIQFTPKMIRAIEGMEKAELSWNTKNVCIKNEKIAVWGRQFDDKYPDYKTIIPNYEPTLILDKSELVDALRKAMISSGPTNKTTLLLTKEKGSVFFETDNTDDQRKNHVKIAGDYSGSTELIAFSAKKMLTVLDQVECEKIRLHIRHQTKAMLLSTEEDADYLGLVMPIFEQGK